MILAWYDDAWTQYLEWQANDKRILRKINSLIEDALRHPTEGLRKPEPLKHSLSGTWSRRINEEHRLVYCFDDETLTVLACKTHYERY